jgi:hypothetical protein
VMNVTVRNILNTWIIRLIPMTGKY